MATHLESNEPERQRTTASDKTLLITKLSIPPPCQILVPRPRLTNALSKALISALTLVSAPAGYGKTTLVSSWLRQNDVSSTWLSLDEGDNDPLRFLQYLVIALQKIVPEIQPDLLTVLQGAQPGSSQALLNILINQIAGCHNPLILVLDDFHTLHAQPVLEIITYLIDHIPSQLHLVLITRTDPPLLLSRLRVRGQLVDIRENQLRFTRQEIISFLNEVMALKLPDDAITALEARTEGWIAGLQLASIAMQSRISMQGPQDIHAFISAFTGSHHYVMDYLVEEVLKLQPKKVGAFLLQTSILDQMCAALCTAVVEADTDGPVDGQAMLEALEGMNLFTIPLDDERRWYRYHHLFADVLRKRLEYQLPHLLPALHQHASQWYQQNGFIPEAIRHALAAGDQDRAIQMIEHNGCLLLIRGELSTLPNWIKAVEPHAQARPWMYIFKAWLFALTGCPERVEEMLQTAEKLISSSGPDADLNLMQGTIATARAYRTNLEGETRQAASFARQALEYLPDTGLVPLSLRTVATALLGDASSMNGELEQARQAYRESRQIGQAAGDIHLVIVANSNLANILIEQGLLRQAAEIYSETLHMATRPDGQKFVIAGRVYLELSQLSYEWNDLETAAQQAQRGLALCRQWGNLDLQAVGSVLLARLEQAQDHPAIARQAMLIAEKLAGEHHLLPKNFIWVKYTLARLWIAQGNLEKVSQIIQESGITTQDEIPYLREPEYLVLLRLLLAQGDVDTALALSKRLLQQAETSKHTSRVIEVLTLQALIFQGKKELDQALIVLKKALALARPERYIRTFIDEGEPLGRLLHLSRSQQIEPEYVTDLLSGFGETAGAARSRSQPLTLREIEVLRLIEAGCTNQDIADSLVISIPTVKRHISNIYTKLGTKNRTQAVALGKALKLTG